MKGPQGKVGWMFRRILDHPLLSPLLDELGPELDSVLLGWGYRPSGRSALRTSTRRGGPLVLLEDAFVRSLRPGNQSAVYGLIADSCGMHYHCDGNSDLLRSLHTGQPCGWMRKQPIAPEETERLMRLFRQSGVSKYNWFPGEYAGHQVPERQGVLVVDQTRGDMSIRPSGLSTGDFDRMLLTAFEEFEGVPVYLRAHPDHLFRGKRSCFTRRLLDDSRLKLLSPDLSPAQCFSFCHTVLVGGSLMGMEALVHGLKVISFGWPFFAGWGVTDDRGGPLLAKRERRLTVADLFEAAYLRYSHYFDPDTREPCGLDSIITHIQRQKDIFSKNRGTTIAVGFTPWNKKILSYYLKSPAGSIRHVKRLRDLAEEPSTNSARVVLWGRKQEMPDDLKARCFRVEDGFLRSKGLGAAFNFPYSWVVDQRGIYFDASSESDLEHILNGGFDPAELEQAGLLIEILREARLTKYNLAGPPVTIDPKMVAGRKVILVPGQVETDASIHFGSPRLKSNLELLLAVRDAEPSAFLVFKAHPDLVAGTRHGKVLSGKLASACDLAVTHGNVLDWLDLCDEVHTLTSTVGFESLIRGVPVVTYGLPFYAGWGLTTDRIPCPRRTRKLTIRELVCGALMRYPRYINPETGEFTTALKVARLLSSGTSAADRRAWHLKAVSRLKKVWVELAR